MKRTTKYLSAAIGLLLFNSGIAFSQEKGFHTGARFGIGEGNIEIEGEANETSKLAFGVGASTTYQFNRYLGLSADFLFVAKGGKCSGQTTGYDFFGVSKQYLYEDNFSLYNAEIPMMLKLSFPLNEDLSLKAYGGPSMQFLLLALQTREYEDPDYNENNGFYDQKMKGLETVEYGFVYGAGFEIYAFDGRTLFMDFRVNQSLSELGKIYDQKAASNYYMISIGYLF